MKFILFCVGVLLFAGSKAQDSIKTTIKSGAAKNEVDVFIKPNFNNNTDYLFQLQFAIGFPASSSPLPSQATVTLNPSFATNFVGSTYSVVVNAMGGSTDNSERYFPIVLTRNVGAPAATSAAQTWAAGTEYPVLTVRFTSPSIPPAQAQVKLVDYQDGGTDFLGNTFTVSGGGTQYYNGVDSRENFYPSSGQSIVGGTAQAGFAQTIALVSLPVNLLNFSGYKSGVKNVLRWTTANENNNTGFEVQRSLDGVNYSYIGFVNTQAPGGTSSTSLNYTFDDNSPVGKKQYYRLRQIDIDAKAKLSNIVLIKEDKPGAFLIGAIFPNPARETINVIINTPQRDDITLLVMDATGKTVKQKLANIETGSNTIPLDVSGLSSGNYVIKTLCKTSNCETATGKFVKL